MPMVTVIQIGKLGGFKYCLSANHPFPEVMGNAWCNPYFYFYALLLFSPCRFSLDFFIFIFLIFNEIYSFYLDPSEVSDISNFVFEWFREPLPFFISKKEQSSISISTVFICFASTTYTRSTWRNGKNSFYLSIDHFRYEMSHIIFISDWKYMCNT